MGHIRLKLNCFRMVKSGKSLMYVSWPEGDKLEVRVLQALISGSRAPRLTLTSSTRFSQMLCAIIPQEPCTDVQRPTPSGCHECITRFYTFTDV